MILFGCHLTGSQRFDEHKFVQVFLLKPNYLQECETSGFASSSCLSLFFSSQLCRALLLPGLFSGSERKGIFKVVRIKHNSVQWSLNPLSPPKLSKRMLKAVFLILKQKLWWEGEIVLPPHQKTKKMQTFFKTLCFKWFSGFPPFCILTKHLKVLSSNYMTDRRPCIWNPKPRMTT